MSCNARLLVCEESVALNLVRKPGVPRGERPEVVLQLALQGYLAQTQLDLSAN
jgi:hypothetical protein